MYLPNRRAIRFTVEVIILQMDHPHANEKKRRRIVRIMGGKGVKGVGSLHLLSHLISRTGELHRDADLCTYA